MRGSSSTIAEVHSDVEAARLCFVISANSERTFPTTSRPASRAGGPDADRPRRLGLPARRSARHQAGPSYPCPGSAQPAPGRPPKLTKPMNVATITRISDFHRLEEGTVMSQSRRSRIGFRGGIADE